MLKKICKVLGLAGVGAMALAATPASAGAIAFYYYDYVGGTPAGYSIHCDSGMVMRYGDTYTGILIYHIQDVGC